MKLTYSATIDRGYSWNKGADVELCMDVELAELFLDSIVGDIRKVAEQVALGDFSDGTMERFTSEVAASRAIRAVIKQAEEKKGGESDDRRADED